MKKRIISLLLILVSCVCVFAEKEASGFYSDKTTLSVVLNFACEKDGIGVKSVDFIDKLHFIDRADGDGIGTTVRYSLPIAKNANKELSLSLIYENLKDSEESTLLGAAKVRSSFLVEFSDKSGKFKADTAFASIGVKQMTGNEYEKGIRVIGKDVWERDGNKFWDNNNYTTELGFTYSFDRNPKVTGLYASVGLIDSSTDRFEEKPLLNNMLMKITGRAYGTFHVIDGKLKVENGYIGLETSGKAGIVNLSEDVAFKYSYNNGPEQNGIYASLLGTNAAINFVDVSARLSFSTETSFHKINNKVKFEINRIALTPWEGLMSFNVLSDNAGASFVLARNLEYRNYSFNKPEENGLFMIFSSDIWFKPNDASKFNVGTTDLTLHSYIKDGKLATSLENITTRFDLTKSFDDPIKKK